MAARAIAACCALFIVLCPITGEAAAQDGAPFAASIELTGTIDPATAGWIVGALADARDDGARIAIVRLDTPGGLDSSMRDIVQAILDSPLPVVVYVAPEGARAASAGLFVTEAGDVAAMAPGTNIGAATPVSIGGGQTDEVLGRKVRNDAAAYVRALAEAHGRNPDLAERMVRDAVSVSARRAREANLVDMVAGSEQELLRALDGFEVQGPKAQTLETSGLAIDRRDMPWHVELRQFLVNPTVAYLLLLGGLLLVAFEALSPGLVGPGLFGAVALVLGLYGTAQLPVTAGGIVLLVLGVGFLIAETQVPSGILGAAGVVALVVGGILLYDTDSEVFAVSIPAAVTAGLLLGALVVFAASRAVSARKRPPRGEPAAELVGRTADVRSALDPQGHVYVGGALWRARATTGEPVPAGRSVVVDDVQGLTLLVHPEAQPKEPT